MDLFAGISEKLSEKTEGLTAEDIRNMLEIPPDPAMGDCALPCFKLARTMRMAPPKIAEALSEGLEIDGIREIKTAGGYLNFYFDNAAFSAGVLGDVLSNESYGSSEEGQGRNVCIDYSSVNIAKPFHIGHLSSTAIGNSLYRIYKYMGYNPVGINHLGDWGTQFGKLIAAYKLWGDDEKIEKDSVSAMLELYVKFHEEAEKDDSLNDEGRAWFKKIEDGDEEALRIFNWFSELTLREAKKVYSMLDIEFDHYTGESFYNDKMDPIVDELKEKGLLEQDEGAYIVRLDEENIPPAIILKSDGATLYCTRDLAAAQYRHDTFDFAKSLYVVAYQQSLHFKQLFAVLKKMGREWAKDCEHVAFGMVSLEGGDTLSTRKGKVVLLIDVLNAAVKKTLETINEKNPDLEDKEQTAHDIGVGAVIYSTLSAGRIKDISFSLDRVLNFDGETGPYVQYTHVRAASVLRKYEGDCSSPDYSVFNEPDAFAVVKQISEFSSAVKTACEKNEPSVITRWVTLLCQYFNKYYYDTRIIDEDEGKTAARIMLTKAVKQTVKQGLYLLGIKAPERM
ncbi:MAG: arginine--tRNA ligase [Christensenellaceae bacterium]|nr:arginine--tRNA ligase [Christensenellaceae bacterium]